MRSNPSGPQIRWPPRAQARPETVLLSRHVAAREKISRSVTKGNSVFPRFQFQDGVPSPVITQVIKILLSMRPDGTWPIFLLLRIRNIGGRKPIEVVEIKPGPLVSLAEAFAHLLMPFNCPVAPAIPIRRLFLQTTTVLAGTELVRFYSKTRNTRQIHSIQHWQTNRCREEGARFNPFPGALRQMSDDVCR